MGRHSAPDDDGEPAGAVADTSDAEAGRAADATGAAEQLAAERRGRHSHGADAETTGPVPGGAVRREADRAAVQDERPTERIDLAAIEAAVAAPPRPQPQQPQPQQPPEPAQAPEPAKRSRAGQSTAADLTLLRRHPDVRNRALGAAVVPFVLYVAVLLVLTATGAQYLLWIWIPMVTAGVLVGFVLDSGHKRHPDEPAERPA